MRLLVAALTLAIFFYGDSKTQAGFLLTESWENPALGGGAQTSVLPAPWLKNGIGYSFIVNGGSGYGFDAFDPLAAPADGNQYLLLDTIFDERRPNVHRLTGVTIEANTVYTLSAAIGNNRFATLDQFWSIQLWADTANFGAFDGSDTFITQQFGTSGTATIADPGSWALNSCSFDSSTTPTLVGRELVILLNGYGSNFSSSYYDNITLSTPTPVSVVPEPSTVTMLASGVAILALFRRRRRGGFAQPADSLQLA